MQVTALYRYPVKSLGGHAVSALTPQLEGFEDDRRWMFVDKNGRFISQRGNVQLAKFSAEINGDTLLFRDLVANEEIGAVAGARSGVPLTVTVWDDTFQATEIQSAALFDLSRKLGIADARLVYLHPKDCRPVDPRYAKPGEQVSFADGFPYLIANTASLEFLAEDVNKPDLEMLRFRPNIVVNAAVPWLEDEWKQLSVGAHSFRLTKPCARCIMITHEPGTGSRDLMVLAALSKHRKVDSKILFGMNSCWEGGPGKVTVGDPVTVLK